VHYGINSAVKSHVLNLLTVSNLNKQFGARYVLKDVNFSVHNGEVLGLIGPNGAGKTTLLECLAGLLPSQSIRLEAEGKPLHNDDHRSVLFYIPDGILPWAEQTVKWVLEFFEKLYVQPKEKLQEMLMPLRLAEIENARLVTLSKGERKRLLLALGLLTSQPLLLLDEPFDGLDLRQARDVMKMLREVAAKGRTLLLSIHQLVDAERVCDRFVLLNDGKVAAVGTLDELRSIANLNEGGLEDIFLALT
jgi:ABC-2 type transport system ATP-binding protein